MTGKAPRRVADVLPALAADLVCVLVFAIAGRGSHEASSSGWLVLAIAWPFAVAAVVAHAAVLMRGRLTRQIWPEGGEVLAVTYLLGMALRVLSGRGTAVPFLIVAVIFLALTMLGWRAILLARTAYGNGNRDLRS